MPNQKITRALISVYYKDHLEPIIHALAAQGVEFVSTGGTQAFIENLGYSVTPVEKLTGYPSIFGGRVKTLHPAVFGGILYRRELAADVAQAEEFGIANIDLVIVDLYPFEETVAKGGTADEIIEKIDIGGISLIRAAAKNWNDVVIVASRNQYADLLALLHAKQGVTDATDRKRLATHAFDVTSHYDTAIFHYFNREQQLPRLKESHQHSQVLRYGENPHQKGTFYGNLSDLFEQLHGKELSYNNLLDLDSALQIVREFRQAAAVVIKHNNPCGCAVSEQLVEAYIAADAGDPVAAFGSILGFNRPVDLATAEQLCVPGRFIEAIIAPEYLPDAFEMLTTVPKWRANVRLLSCPQMLDPRPVSQEYRRVTGGLLVQDRDDAAEPTEHWKVVTARHPTAEESADLEFAWKVCKHVKSNAVLIAQRGALVGVGAGQMSRLDSAFMAAHKAGERSRGGVCASDAFFPFRDGIDQLAQAGIVAVIQPGGSKRDDEVIEACNYYGMAMIFTGRRHFRH